MIIPIGIFWTYLIPPFQTPDETVHFYRAFEVAEGHMTSGHDENGRIGNYFSASIQEFVDKVKLEEIAFHPEVKLSSEELEEVKTIYLSEENQIFYYFPSSAIYSPVPYLPQALGIFMAKGLDWSVFSILVTARVFNLIAYALLTFYAIKIIPKLKSCLFLLAFMPMSLHQAASISGDALLFGVSFLLIAYVCRFIFSEEATKFTIKDFLIILALSSAASLAKPAYFLLFLLLFLVPVQKYGSKMAYWKYNMSIAVLSVAALFSWMAFGNKAAANNDPIEQTKWILLHPLQYLKQFFGTFLYGDQLYLQFVGVLGWVDTPIPYIISFLFTILFTASIIMEKRSGHENKDTVIRGLLLLAIFLIEAAVVVTMLFLAWPQNDPSRVLGVQGRYFIPIFPLLAYGLYAALPGIKKIPASIYYTLAVIFSLFISSYWLYNRFYQ
nr:DUF2142 domain-containing protein [Bacillus benzoevorans]